MRILVLGARGAVGKATASTLRAAGHQVTPAGRTAPTGGLAIDLTTTAGFDALGAAAPEHRIVVNASGIEDPRIMATMSGAILVDPSATAAYLAQLSRAAQLGSTPVVLGAGLAPGLSTQLVAAVAGEPGDEIDLAIMLGGGETHGAAAVEWTAGLAGREVWEPPEQHAVVNLREHRRLRTGRRTRTGLRADFPDHFLIGRPRGVAVRSYLATDGPLTTAALGLVGRFPALAPLIARAPHLGSDRWSLTATNRRTGETLSATGAGQSRTTGGLTALAALAAADAETAPTMTAADVLTLDDVTGAGLGITIERW
ncbi:saccharopine dehydrogenase [Nocardia rhizosphaerae]|uniref:Saccharopine dehydrogenase n=1 Tax=Nocardia rhizosphaerae TaxID=1691571 RepID=A0ABV8LD34_9NOCA